LSYCYLGKKRLFPAKLKCGQLNRHRTATANCYCHCHCQLNQVMVSYAVCADIGRNNAGTVTGAMNFFGQMGAFFLALIFGQMVQASHRFDYPVYVVAAVLIAGCRRWAMWMSGMKHRGKG